ncbi:neutrophil gelatinase-associated lipocalin [Nelusetta ayraudi]|uniref:neutrophil gelatinase-associated lipocalin n=1 Tax=Nelusetta ayraudi TaxID=303726 RepID=UPI003F726140
MRTTVLAVAMVMACLAAAHEDVRPQRDFNLQRFAGRWYRVGLAYASEKFAPFRDKLKASMGVVTALPDGNVNLTMYDATPLGCLVKVYHYQKTNVPGQFTYFSTRHNLVKDMTVVETNYTDYALVVKHKVFNREYTQVALYGRSTAVRTSVLDRFRSFALSQGFPRDSILTPPPAENCPPSESGL